MLDTVIKMNLVLFGTICLVAFLVLIARTVAACIVFPEKDMNAHIPILMVAVAAIELVIFGLGFAKYLIGG